MSKLLRALHPPGLEIGPGNYYSKQLQEHGYLYLDRGPVGGEFFHAKSVVTGKHVILVREWTEEPDDGEEAP